MYLSHSGKSKLDGAKIGSGRYPLGSGARPNQHHPQSLFISGSSKTQDKSTPYYRKRLPREIKNIIDDHISKGGKILVGDASGIDRQVQNYLHSKGYGNVEVFGPGEKVRYQKNKNWKSHPVDSHQYEPGSKEWLAEKDILMTKMADVGLAVVLDGGAKATRKNIDRLIEQHKDVKVYELSKDKKDKWWS